MTFHLWHKDYTRFNENSPAVLAAFPAGFTHVADVELAEYITPTDLIASNILDRVFELTNHIDHSWTTNPEVTLVGSDHLRSTSVGDVITTDAAGKFTVEGVGFFRFDRGAANAV